MQNITGFLLINKPLNITSFFCVTYIKKIIKSKNKIGHAGTLDPFATGLLIIAIGREATREIRHLITLDKEYIAKGKLGELRDTLDYTGSILKTNHATTITEKMLQQAVQSLGTRHAQTPPIYSALKYQGTPLHKLARNNKLSTEQLHSIVALKKRLVQLYTITLLDFSFPYFTVKSHVSHGTYIRSLMQTIASKVGTYATTYELTRTKIGLFNLTHAVNLTTIKQLTDIQKHIISVPNFCKKQTMIKFLIFFPVSYLFFLV